MKRKVLKAICVCLMITLAFGCVSTVTFAKTKTYKTTFYDCYVKDGIAYCATDNGIYKVNIKKEKVKRLVKTNPYKDGYIVCLTMHKGKLYYQYASDKTYICRVKTSGKSKKKLAGYWSLFEVSNVAIDGKYIYYEGFKDENCTKKYTKRMKLNGKDKTKVKVKIKTKTKATNNKKYELDYFDNPDNIDYQDVYLVTPKKNIYITTTK